MNDIFTQSGVSAPEAFGAFLGAVVSLKFIDGLNVWQRITTVICGTAIAYHSSQITMSVFALSPKIDGAVSFLIGLFGMSLAGAVMNALPGIVIAVRNKFLGGGNDR